MTNKDFEPIRVRIMQEAYELADRNDAEGYNAIKVMCGDVQKMLSPKPMAQNFCPRCGKRTPDLTTIHTCTPPRGLEMT